MSTCENFLLFTEFLYLDLTVSLEEVDRRENADSVNLVKYLIKPWHCLAVPLDDYVELSRVDAKS